MKATGSYPLKYVMKRSGTLLAGICRWVSEVFDNMGGNAEDLAFRPMHVKPFYVCRMKGFLCAARRAEIAALQPARARRLQRFAI